MLQKNTLGWFCCIVCAVVSVVLWAMVEPFGVRFISLPTTFASLGEVTGLVGMVFFSLDFLLAARWKWMEPYFGGQNNVYMAHHILGGIAFILLLLHPLLLTGTYVFDNIKSALLFLLPGSDWTINLGIASLMLMTALLILTFFVELPYQVWKYSHKFLGAAFFIGAIHSFFVSSDIIRNKPLQDYMLFFAVFGLLAYLYRTIFWRLFVRRLPFVVTAVTHLKDNVIEIDLQSEKKPLKFLPGQFIFISFKDTNITKESHPFSISSSPSENTLAIAVKTEGDYTKQLQNLRVGAKAYVEGPFGNFEYEKCTNKQQVWIGGGIGITPFIAMAKTLFTHPDIQVDLYYSMHDEKESVYVEQLQDLATKEKNLSVAPFFTTQHGRLSAEIIEKASGDIEKKDFFLCGPPPMMHSLKIQLRKLGVAKKQIHSEEFSWE